MTADLLVTGGLVLARESGAATAQFREVDVVVAGGRIAALAPCGAFPPSEAREVVDAGSRLILPGLVNAHAHSYGQVCRHCLNDDTLEPWIPRAVAFARAMTPADVGLAARLQGAEALRFGITTLLDHARLDASQVDAAIDAYEEVGVRAVLAPQLSDRRVSDSLPSLDPALDVAIRAADSSRPAPTDLLLAMMRGLIDRVERSSLVTAAVGPSSAERCTPELLTGLAALAADRGLAVHAHLLESRLQRLGGDPLAILEAASLLGPRTSLAHAIHLTDRDRARIAEAGATLVHNPLSNLATGAGYFDLAAARKAGVRVAFGTDAFNCGGSQDLLTGIRVGMTLGRPDLGVGEWLWPADAWRMATEVAADAIGLGEVTGRLEPGYAADFLVFDPARAGYFDGPGWLEQITYGGLGAGLDRVYVAGKLVAHGGHVRHVDERSLAEEAGRAYVRIAESSQAEQAAAEALKAHLRDLTERARVRTG